MSDPIFEALLRQNFHVFAEKAYGILVPNSPLQRNWHHQALAYHLQQAAEGKIRRLIITVQPRSLKSIFGSIALPAWSLGRWPEKRILCISYSADLAHQFATGTRDIMDSAFFKATYPNCKIRRGAGADDDFLTTKRGGRFATSVQGTLTGRGGNLIIIDDPIKAEDIYSEVRRQKVIRWFRETVITRLDNKNNDTIIVIMQRLHVDDLAGTLIEDGGWTVLDLPAIAQEEHYVALGEQAYHFRPKGALLHPEWEGQQVLDELRRSVGDRAFSAQYLQRPVPPDGTIWHLSWFGRYKSTVEKEVGDQVIQSWDTAQKTGLLNDYSVCTTWLVKEDRRSFLIDVYRARLEFPELRRKIIELASFFNANEVLIEDASSGQSLIQDFERNNPLPRRCYLKPIRDKRDKIERAEAASIAIEAGSILFPTEAPWVATLSKEIRDFPRGNDDQVDSVSQLINYVQSRKIYANHINVTWPT